MYQTVVYICRHNGFSVITFVLVDHSFWNFNTMILGLEWLILGILE